jgi:outer membrane protein OmpA-like peptidoglycan-associated protein
MTAADAVAETLAAPAATAAAGTAAAPAAKKKDRLSDLEKALLIGLGAVAVGAIISNNRKVALNSGDRVVVTRDDGSYQVIKDDDTLLRQPGSRVRTERFNDGSTRTTVTRDDGTRVVTIRDAEYRVLRRVHIDRAGRQTVLIDDTIEFEPVDITTLPPPARQPVIRDTSDELALRLALEREARIGRQFSLAQVRGISEVRALVPVIDLDAITFDSGSAAISPDQARALSSLGSLIQGYIDENPREVFLVEGHTDATGGAAYNLALSDRRAESVALALTEYFGVPPENLVVQGYGEAYLKIDSQADERANRRASVRRITDLLRQAAAD